MYKKHEINSSNYKVAVLCGGNSSERKISISSGTCVCKALLDSGFKAEKLDPSFNRDWIKLLTNNFDIVFNVLHGKFGEDGTIQSVLEMIDIPYTGSGVYACKKSMNKNITKALYASVAVPTPNSFSYVKGENLSYDECVNRLGQKFVIKPANEGSSVGAHIIFNDTEFYAGLENAFSYDDELIIETFVEGREFTVSVLGNEDAKALPIVEIVPKSDFYDFSSKYEEGGSKHICPVKIPNSIGETMMNAALKAHWVLKANGVSRSDILMDKDKNIYVLETNAIPGMTPTSLLPDAARVEGLTYEDLCTELIYLGLERFGKLNNSNQ